MSPPTQHTRLSRSSLPSHPVLLAPPPSHSDPLRRVIYWHNWGWGLEPNRRLAPSREILRHQSPDHVLVTPELALLCQHGRGTPAPLLTTQQPHPQHPPQTPPLHIAGVLLPWDGGCKDLGLLIYATSGHICGGHRLASPASSPARTRTGFPYQPGPLKTAFY